MIFKYEVEYYDSFKDEERKSRGLTWAKSYSAAAANVCDEYGDDSVLAMKFYACGIDEDATCFDLDGEDGDDTYMFKVGIIESDPHEKS